MSQEDQELSDISPPSGKDDEIFHRVGLTLMLIQIAELRINRALLVVSADETLTMEQLEQMDESRRSRTLGNALNELRKHVEFPADLQAFVEKFIKNRNTLAHRFFSIPGVGLETERERKIANDFLFDLTDDAFKAIYIFGVLLHSLLQDRGLGEPLEKIAVSLFKFVQTAHPEVKKMFPGELPPELLGPAT